MSIQLQFFALYSTALLLTMLVEKSTCPNGKHGPARDRSPHSPSRYPTDPTRGPGDVSHRGVQRLAGGMIELPATAADQNVLKSSHNSICLAITFIARFDRETDSPVKVIFIGS
ncbi:uncharacterized protein LOC142765974 [Rhipicephalus microplus]|uniref:uncharacterized protein LOC142765974 n=1 Tax=Rhipicephalus microplus TaxID=6941 RepID=UPI003F6AE0D0